MAQKRFSVRSTRKKRLQKIVYIVLTIALGAGLIGSSIVWTTGKSNLPQNTENKEQGDLNQNQSIQERIYGLEKKVQTDQKDLKTMVELAEAYLGAGMIPQAEKTYQQVLSLEPGNAKARLSLAVIYYNFLNRNDLAAKEVQEILKKDPDNKNAHYLYGFILAEEKNYKDAIKEMENFIKLADSGIEEEKLQVEKAQQSINLWRQE